MTGVTVGTITTVEDDHQPGLDGSLVGFMPIMQPGGMVDWVFHWYTDYSSDMSLDRVEVIAPDAVTLHATDPGVEHTYQKVSGGYYHELRWLDQPCAPKTTVKYKVASGVSTPGHPLQWSGTRSHTITLCVQ